MTNELNQHNNNMSTSIAALAAALSKAQGEFDHAKKDVKNEFFKSKYADLASVIDAARLALAKNGLAVVQTTHSHGDNLILQTTLMHASGEWLRGEYPIRPVKQDPQGYGSALTYARRYAFSAITGIASEDDDGNAASAAAPSPKSVFSTAALLKQFTQNVVDSITRVDEESDGAKEELNTLSDLNAAKIAELKASGNDRDEMAVDEIRKQYALKKQAIDRFTMLTEQLRAK